MKRVILFVLTMCACSQHQTEQRASSITSTDIDCLSLTEPRLDEWEREGLSSEEMERRFNLALASCAGDDIDSATAVFLGAANVDYHRLALHFIRTKIDATTYATSLRSRAAKIKQALADKRYISDWLAGDVDGDLVPDIRDDCLDSTDLIGTNSRGCPILLENVVTVKDKPARDILGKLGYMRSQACDGAEPPDLPSPISLSYVQADHEMELIVSKATNQPEKCPVFYEVAAKSDRWQPGASQYSHVVLYDSESISSDPKRLVFRINGNESIGRYELFGRFASSYTTTWRVRAVNGNGLASRYGLPLKSPSGILRSGDDDNYPSSEVPHIP